MQSALARLDDGRTIVYGNMGGDGQPQSQSAVFSRIAQFGMNPQAAIAAPRWLLGRTWGQDSDSLKLESRFPQQTVDRLRALGHVVDVVDAFDEGSFWDRVDESFAALRADPVASADYDRELREWDTVLADGLEPE